MEECAGCKLQFDPQEESVFPASALDRDGRSASGGGGGGGGDVGWVEVVGTAGDTELLCCDCYIERRAMAERLAPASGRPLCAAGAAAASSGYGGGAASSVASSAHTPEPTDIYAPAVRHALLYRSTPLTIPSASPPPPRHPPMPMRASSAGSSDAAAAAAAQPLAAAAR
eukprot:Rhum_TRINITY_DN6658_c0_g1::Rhum_TRINITY_DN6658_c0_g1_i1::g.20659::m.20659